MTYCCRVRCDNMLYEVKLFMSLLKKLTYQIYQEETLCRIKP